LRLLHRLGQGCRRVWSMYFGDTLLAELDERELDYRE
jgi:hypothetical protein